MSGTSENNKDSDCVITISDGDNGNSNNELETEASQETPLHSNMTGQQDETIVSASAPQEESPPTPALAKEPVSEHAREPHVEQVAETENADATTREQDLEQSENDSNQQEQVEEEPAPPANMSEPTSAAAHDTVVEPTATSAAAHNQDTVSVEELPTETLEQQQQEEEHHNDDDSIPPPPPVQQDNTNNDMDEATMQAIMADQDIPPEMTLMMNQQELFQAWVQQQNYDLAHEQQSRSNLPQESFNLWLREQEQQYMQEVLSRHGSSLRNRSLVQEAAPAVPDSNGPPNHKKRRWLWIGAMVAVMVIVGVVLGVVLGLSSGGSSGNANSNTNNNLHAIVVIQPDAFPQHTSWLLREGGSDTFGPVLHRVTSGFHPSIQSTVAVPVVAGQTYTFRIADTGHDGICCSVGRGYYFVLRSDNGQRLVAGNGDFGKSSQHTFVV